MRSLLTMRPGMPDAAAGAHPFDVTYVNHALKTVRFLLDRVAGRVQREDGDSQAGMEAEFRQRISAKPPISRSLGNSLPC